MKTCGYKKCERNNVLFCCEECDEENCPDRCDAGSETCGCVIVNGGHLREVSGVALLIPGDHTAYKVGRKFLDTEAVITRISVTDQQIKIYGAKEGAEEKLRAEICNAPWITFYNSEDDTT